MRDGDLASANEVFTKFCLAQIVRMPTASAPPLSFITRRQKGCWLSLDRCPLAHNIEQQNDYAE